MERRLERQSFDLVLAEFSGAELELCALIQRLRQGKVGDNPFIVIIVTTWRRDGNLINHLINSGADDVLTWPFSAAQLGERLRSQVERRKQFVVTCDYIGPDRRRDPERAGAECIDVPNTLRLRAQAGEDQDGLVCALAREVSQGKNLINREKLRRDVFQLCLQWRKFEQRRHDPTDEADILDKLCVIAADMRRRTQELNDVAGVEWCRSVVGAARSIRVALDVVSPGGGPPDLAEPLYLLGKSVLALGNRFAPGEVEPAQLVELDALVARVDIREGSLRGPPPATGSPTPAG